MPPRLWRHIFLALMIFSFSLTINAEEHTLIALSDIHFNPFYDCEKSKGHCKIAQELMQKNVAQWNDIFSRYETQDNSPRKEDTNYVLLKSVLAAVVHERQIYSPQFVIIPGDFLVHDFHRDYRLYTGDRTQAGYETFVRKIFLYLTDEIQKALPGISIYPAVGNNDSYHGDYVSIPNGRFFLDTEKMWINWIGKNSGTFSQTYPVGGYYAITISSGLRLIVLNTNFFQKEHSYRADYGAAEKQLQWLKQQLIAAKKSNQTVWFVFHIPVGVDIYNTIFNLKKHIISFWRPQMQREFFMLLNDYASVVTAIFTGHMHMDAFQLIKTKTNVIPDTFVSSLSPVFGNNPSFKIYSYSDTHPQLMNFVAFYLVNNSIQQGWQKEYDFNQTYQPHCNPCFLVDGMQRLSAQHDVAKKYVAYVMSQSDSRTYVKKYSQYFWCAIRYRDDKKYQDCLKRAD